MVPDISTGIPRAPAYSGADSTRYPLRLRGSHPLWPGIPAGSARLSLIFGVGPITPAPALRPRRFGLFPVRSPLLGKSLLLSFPMGTKMFQFPTFASLILKDDGIASAGLPHSDIRGSMGICPSPRLFAACHVLLRLREPRHPPCALLVPLYVSRSLRLIVFFRLAFALPYLPSPPCLLEHPGSVSMRRSLCSTLVVCSQCSVTYTASPVCQCTRSLVPAVPVRTAAGGFSSGSPWQS